MKKITQEKQSYLIWLFIRAILSIFVLYKVYGETGIWTAMTLGLLWIGFEYFGYSLRLMLGGFNTKAAKRQRRKQSNMVAMMASSPRR